MGTPKPSAPRAAWSTALFRALTWLLPGWMRREWGPDSGCDRRTAGTRHRIRGARAARTRDRTREPLAAESRRAVARLLTTVSRWEEGDVRARQPAAARGLAGGAGDPLRGVHRGNPDRCQRPTGDARRGVHDRQDLQPSASTSGNSRAAHGEEAHQPGADPGSNSGRTRAGRDRGLRVRVGRPRGGRRGVHDRRTVRAAAGNPGRLPRRGGRAAPPNSFSASCRSIRNSPAAPASNAS